MKYKNNLSHNVMIQGPVSVINVSPGEIVELPDSASAGILSPVLSGKPKQVGAKPKAKKEPVPTNTEKTSKITSKTDIR